MEQYNTSEESGDGRNRDRILAAEAMNRGWMENKITGDLEVYDEIKYNEAVEKGVIDPKDYNRIVFVEKPNEYHGSATDNE